MRFALLSDLHLECSQYTSELPAADVLLLAGDIASANPSAMRKEGDFLRRCYEKYGEDNVVQIEGNHEQYHGSWEHLLQGRYCYVYDDIVVIACTLWSGEESKLAYKFMNDSRLIEGFSWTKMNKEHELDVAFIVEKLKEHKDKKCVVVTHHLPSVICVSEKYLVDLDKHFINHAFYTDLDWIMKEHAPAVWCHGHTHDSIDKQHINTRIVCNPRGYTTYRGIENKDFNPMFTFEV